MATAAVESYRHEAFQSLPSLLDAFDTFLKKSPQMTIEQKMMALFAKHDVYNDLSVCLIHRHFDMSPNEKLVEFGAVSTPWSYHQPDNNLMGGSVVPRTWVFKAGKMMPVEFGYNEAGKAPIYKDIPDKPGFYAEFNDLLDQEGLGDLLGLTLLTERKKPGVTKLEKTYGRSNVVFTMAEQDIEVMEKEFIPAQWEFAPVEGNILVPIGRLRCTLSCRCS